LKLLVNVLRTLWDYHCPPELNRMAATDQRDVVGGTSESRMCPDLGFAAQKESPRAAEE